MNFYYHLFWHDSPMIYDNFVFFKICIYLLIGFPLHNDVLPTGYMYIAGPLSIATVSGRHDPILVKDIEKCKASFVEFYSPNFQ